jgi:hypothetical protein
MNAEQPEKVYREETVHGDLVLKIHHGTRPHASLVLEGTFLMDSDVAESERELAWRGLAFLEEIRKGAAPDGVGAPSGPGTSGGLAALGRSEASGGPGASGDARTAGPRPPVSGHRVLVAGLGLGITLKALLESPAVGAVDVVEILPPVVAWNRGPLAILNGGALEDPRVQVFEADLEDFLLAGEGAGCVGPGRTREPVYDLLLLDIDNGPTWLSLERNAWLYGKRGLEHLRRHTAIPGVIALWATEASADFEEVLEGVTWATWRREGVPCHVEGERSLEYFLYLLARRS